MTTATATLNDRQVGGEHYKARAQHWDWVAAINLPYLPAQVSKYLIRWRKKNGLQDLKKADHFLDKFIEERSSEGNRIGYLTDELIDANGVIDAELEVIHDLVRYHIGSLRALADASKNLKKLIAVVERNEMLASEKPML